MQDNWKSNEFDLSNMDLSKAQQAAFIRLMENLNENPVSCQVLPAGAGAGKTYLLSNVIGTMMKMGCSPDAINAISFTNLSADELQVRVIKNQYSILGSFHNMAFNTIHSHAFNMIRRLAPHIHGVNLPFEKDMNNVSISEENNFMCNRSLRLAFYASVQSGLNYEYLKNMLDDNTFPLKDIKDIIGLKDYIEAILGNCKRLPMSSFLDNDSNDLSYPAAVATEALLKINEKVKNGDISASFFRDIGVPEVLILDEAQDIDLTQLLYLRAMSLCGTNIIMVGDRNQTLYRWRNALGGLIFSHDFMSNLFADDTGVYILYDTPLNENWRSRKEILQFSDMVVSGIRETANTGKNDCNFSYFSPIDDGDQGSMVMEPQIETHKDLSSVTILCEDGSNNHNKSVSLVRGAKTSTYRLRKEYEGILEGTYTPMRELFKNRDVNLICDWIKQIGKRINLGESAVIITHHNATLDDISMIKEIMNDANIPIVKVSSEKCVALSQCPTVCKEDDKVSISNGIPLSHLMSTIAMHYILDDTETLSGNTDVPDTMPCHYNVEECRDLLIAQGYFDSAYQYVTNLAKIINKRIRLDISGIENILADYVIDVLAMYGSISWKENTKGQKPGGESLYVPYRFTGISGNKREVNGGFIYEVRNASEQKRLFQWLWMALSNTYYAPTEINGKFIVPGVVNDILVSDMSLSNIASLSGNYLKNHGHVEDVPYVNDIVRTRENAFEAFQNAYTSTLRSWLKMIFNNVETLNRDNGETLQDAMRICFDEYMMDEALRAKKGLKTVMGNYKPYGLINAFCAKNEEQTLMKRNVDRTPHSLELSTIHASKGMEWDHVLFITGDGFGIDKLNGVSTMAVTHHDNTYVTLTRARQTLAIATLREQKENNLRVSTIPEHIVDHIIYQIGKENNLINVPLSFNDDVQEKNKSQMDVIVRNETNHSELEVAMKCSQAYDLEHRRAIKSMSLIPTTTYPIFFHNIMSEIVASLTKQRFVDNEDTDNVNIIAASINEIIRNKETTYTEQDILNIFDGIKNSFKDTVYSLIPGYLYDVNSPIYGQLLQYYTSGLQSHLASICHGSKLFHDIIEAYELGISPMIEKTMRNIVQKDGIVLPFQGIPDVAIVFPDRFAVYDYKSVPKPTKSDKMDKHISLNVVLQLTIYMGLSQDDFIEKKMYAEAIYVQDITARNDKPDLDKLPRLKDMYGGFGFINGKTTEHARILVSHSFNHDLFSIAGGLMENVKRRAEEQKDNLYDESLRMPVPVCQLEEGNEIVGYTSCMGCQQNKSCSKSKMIEFYRRPN